MVVSVEPVEARAAKVAVAMAVVETARVEMVVEAVVEAEAAAMAVEED